MHISKEKTKGAMIRTKTNWEMLGERSSGYFLKLERKQFTNKTLYRIKNKQGVIIEGQKEILSEIENYYSKLYMTKGKITKTYIEKLEIPQISQQMKGELERPITQYEISLAIKEMKLNKTPGCDGLPIDFYKVFYPKIREFLLKLFHEIVREGEFHLSAKRGILSLLEKVGKESLLLRNWHVLTLLECGQ